jgi:hypothetical protein
MSVDDEMKKLDDPKKMEKGMATTNGLYGFSKVVKECLRNYLFIISIDGKENCAETTCYTREITWTKDEITIDTLVEESASNFHDLVNMKKLKVSFLDRTGNRVFDETFDIKGLKYKHPLHINQEAGMLIYRFVFEY